ncbi:MAG: putative toxin-antitoxin system toxin component, PIN family [Anaerolineae bacterium]|nr:putative toxin-antitoxin system toxin component, PIN family [Anaerolineae bacterium]
MSKHQIVIDTNVIVSALQSSRGASFKLLMLLGKPSFDINISIPLILEYEDVTKRLIGQIPLTGTDIDRVLDYICKVANQHNIFFLWRPFLKDPKDDMVLELAVTAQCDFIVTYNQKDFKHINQFGIEAITPKEFLQKIGELP